jgi:three-Cys-motif partner protein
MAPRHAFALANEADTRPDLPVERGKRGKGVGPWVREQKHQYLAKWIEGTREMRRRWPERVYLDLFCGPGRMQVRNESGTRHGGAAIAWLHSQRGGAAFTRCIVGELLGERVDACTARLLALSAPVMALKGPAADTADAAARLVPPGALTLAYLDPYNLGYLSWSIIERLAQLQNVDFAVHWSTADLTRNVRLDYQRQGQRFDQVAPGWRDRVDVEALIRGDADQQFFDYWCGLVGSLGFTISERIPLVRSERNAPLYHLVFFSRHPSPIRVWSDVAQGKNRELF